MHDVDLAAAAYLAQASLAHQAVAPFGDEGLDRDPLRRGRRHQREVAQAAEGHVERARDRRRREREHVDVGPHLLEPFLVADAEPVLLVHDDQAEVAERHVALQQPVRADDDVDRTGLEAGDHRALVRNGAKARQALDTHRPVGEAVGERLGVLLREQRRRHQHRDLPAAGDRGERGPKRNFRLAEADVAADHAIHRLAGAHVGQHGLDRLVLVDRLLERERRLEDAIGVFVERERPAFACRAARVEIEQFRGDVAHALGCAAPGTRPLLGAELVPGRRFG